MLPLVTALLAPLWLLPLAGFLRVCRARYTLRRRRGTIWTTMAMLLILHVVLLTSPLVSWLRPDHAEAATASWLRQFSETLPGGALVLWVPALAILATCLLLVGRGFRTLEADHSSCTVCLLV